MEESVEEKCKKTVVNKGYRGRHYVATIFDHEDKGIPFERFKQDLTYYCFGHEICPKSKKKHLQAYMMFTKDMRWTQVRDLLAPNYVAGKRGTVKQAIDYCMKDGKFEEFGEKPKERGEAGGAATKRNWEEAWEQAKSGDLEAMDKSILIPHYNAIKKIKYDHMPMPQDLVYKEGECPNIWVYGPTRTGKSYFVRNNPLYKASLYLKPCNKWWDSYANEDYVLIEDIGPSHEVLGYHLKIWADRYAFKAESKFLSVNLRPKGILVTSNYHPKDIWKDSNIYEPILRRFKLVLMEKPYEEPKEQELFPDKITGGYMEEDVILNQTSLIAIPDVNEIKEFS